MNVSIKTCFIKDYQNLPVNTKREIKRICLIIFPKLRSLFNFREYKTKPIKGFKGYYRIKLGDFRLGFKKENLPPFLIETKEENICSAASILISLSRGNAT